MCVARGLCYCGMRGVRGSKRCKGFCVLLGGTCVTIGRTPRVFKSQGEGVLRVFLRCVM